MDLYKIDIQKLATALGAKLPGEEAQFRMAPVARPRMADAISEGATFRKAAVLLPLFRNDGEDFVLLTLRSTYDGVHSGQVSFPGGKFDESETDPVDVALREMEEEVGVSAEGVKVLGLLSPLYIPVSRMHVQPVVAWINYAEWLPHEKEVAGILEVPIRLFSNPEVIQTKWMELTSRGEVEVPYYELLGHTVWGATAMILSEFLAVLKSTEAD